MGLPEAPADPLDAPKYGDAWSIQNFFTRFKITTFTAAEPKLSPGDCAATHHDCSAGFPEAPVDRLDAPEYGDAWGIQNFFTRFKIATFTAAEPKLSPRSRSSYKSRWVIAPRRTMTVPWVSQRPRQIH